jgi:hypothetical protein
MSVATQEPATQDRTAQLQRHTREFASLYERNAYRVYNLALRTTCERESAIESAARAFLTQLDHPGDEGHLIAAVVSTALGSAKPNPRPHGAGDQEAEAMLSATATLPPSERAALALGTVASVGPGTMGRALGLPPDNVAALHDRALDNLAAQLGVDRDQAEVAYGAWLLAAPPDPLWETLYPSFHAAIDRQLRQTGAAEASNVVALPAAATAAVAVPVSRPSRFGFLELFKDLSNRRTARRAVKAATRPAPAPVEPRRGGGVLRTLVAVAILAGAVYGGIQLFGGDGAAQHKPLYQSSNAPGTGAGLGTPGAPGTAQPGQQLSQAEMDRLRQQQIAAQQQAAQRGGAVVPGAGAAVNPAKARKLTRAQKAQQAKQIALQRKMALREQKIAMRREQIARKQARKQQADQPPPPPPTSSRSTPSGPTTSSGAQGNTSAPPPPSSSSTSGSATQSSPKGSSAPSSKDEADQSCLFDSSSGTYVCPK